MRADTPASAPQEDKGPSLTSDRVHPPLPTVEREDVAAVRKLITTEVARFDLEDYGTVLRLLMAVNFLVRLLNHKDEDVVLMRLQVLAEMLHIDLPPTSTGGEGPR